MTLQSHHWLWWLLFWNAVNLLLSLSLHELRGGFRNCNSNTDLWMIQSDHFINLLQPDPERALQIYLPCTWVSRVRRHVVFAGPTSPQPVAMCEFNISASSLWLMLADDWWWVIFSFFLPWLKKNVTRASLTMASCIWNGDLIPGEVSLCVCSMLASHTSDASSNRNAPVLRVVGDWVVVEGWLKTDIKTHLQLLKNCWFWTNTRFLFTG